MIGIKKTVSDAGQTYREEPVKPAIYTMLVVVAIVAVPLGWLNQKINAEGSKVADVSRFEILVTAVKSNGTQMQQMRAVETVDERALKGSMVPVVTFIAPDVAPTNAGEATLQETDRFKIKLSGTYRILGGDPIATINGETYHVGDSVLEHRIVEIRETEVVFENPMGDKVVKRMYEEVNQQN